MRPRVMAISINLIYLLPFKVRIVNDDYFPPDIYECSEWEDWWFYFILFFFARPYLPKRNCLHALEYIKMLIEKEIKRMIFCATSCMGRDMWKRAVKRKLRAARVLINIWN